MHPILRSPLAGSAARVLFMVCLAACMTLSRAGEARAGACYGEEGACAAECPLHCTAPECLPPVKCDCEIEDVDVDADGYKDGCDNCPDVPNPLQEDTDVDGVGNACESGSTLAYILALNGDNHAGQSPFTPGDPADGKTYTAGSTITWEVRVIASGVHSNPGGPGHDQAVIGAAAMLFSLELRAGTAQGNLVAIGAGSSTSGGWFSQINDGTTNPLQYAAFCHAFDLDGDTVAMGRLIDPLSLGGPGLTSFQYPAVFGFPTGTTTQAGVLARMGAAYSSYNLSEQASGVGLTRARFAACRWLGAVPLFEGQIHTSSLLPGTYVLKCVSPAGNVVLDGTTCGTADEGTNIQPVNAVMGDAISFELESLQ